MPVIRPSGRSRAADSLKVRLTELLLRELMGESINNGPVVFEDPIQPDLMNVIVVWEAWGGLSQDDRASIIREVYARYSRDLEQSIHYIDPARKPDSPSVPRLMNALGVTFDEVEELGLLPFSVAPTVSPGEVDPDELETFMIEAGAIQTPAGYQLRLPNVRTAAEVRARLEEDMPEARWSMSKISGPYDE